MLITQEGVCLAEVGESQHYITIHAQPEKDRAEYKSLSNLSKDTSVIHIKFFHPRGSDIYWPYFPWPDEQSDLHQGVLKALNSLKVAERHIYLDIADLSITRTIGPSEPVLPLWKIREFIQAASRTCSSVALNMHDLDSYEQVAWCRDIFGALTPQTSKLILDNCSLCGYTVSNVSSIAASIPASLDEIHFRFSREFLKDKLFNEKLVTLIHKIPTDTKIYFYPADTNDKELFDDLIKTFESITPSLAQRISINTNTQETISKDLVLPSTFLSSLTTDAEPDLESLKATFANLKGDVHIPVSEAMIAAPQFLWDLASIISVIKLPDVGNFKGNIVLITENLEASNDLDRKLKLPNFSSAIIRNSAMVKMATATPQELNRTQIHIEDESGSDSDSASESSNVSGTASFEALLNLAHDRRNDIYSPSPILISSEQAQYLSPFYYKFWLNLLEKHNKDPNTSPAELEDIKLATDLILKLFIQDIVLKIQLMVDELSPSAFDEMLYRDGFYPSYAQRERMVDLLMLHPSMERHFICGALLSNVFQFPVEEKYQKNPQFRQYCHEATIHHFLKALELLQIEVKNQSRLSKTSRNLRDFIVGLLDFYKENKTITRWGEHLTAIQSPQHLALQPSQGLVLTTTSPRWTFTHSGTNNAVTFAWPTAKSLDSLRLPDVSSDSAVKLFEDQKGNQPPNTLALKH